MSRFVGDLDPTGDGWHCRYQMFVSLARRTRQLRLIRHHHLHWYCDYRTIAYHLPLCA